MAITVNILALQNLAFFQKKKGLCGFFLISFSALWHKDHNYILKSEWLSKYVYLNGNICSNVTCLSKVLASGEFVFWDNLGQE